MPNLFPPHVRASLTTGSSASREYYQWFNLVGSTLGQLSTAVDDVKASIASLPSSGISQVKGSGSISAKESGGIVTVSLFGDYVDAGVTRYYGTDSTGARGFFPVSDAFADSANIEKQVDADTGIVTFDLTDLTDTGTGALLAFERDGKGRVTGTKAATITGTAGNITVTNGDAVAGLPTIDLADVSVTSGGTLKKRAFDAKGRLSQESAATTTDLAEGTNLYFTDARVRSTTLTGLSTATATAVTAADSVLVGIGKLQGQLGDKVNNSTTVFPSNLQITGPSTNDGSVIFNSGSTSSSSTGAYLRLYANSSGSPGRAIISSGSGADVELSPGSVGNALRASFDNNRTLGSASFRWSVVYAGTGTINTSDAREKTPVTPMTDAEIAASAEMARSIGTYQWLASIAEKGDAARHHAGLTVQQAIAIMQSNGLDPFRYGFICYDAWEETPEVIDPETGEVAQSYRPAGDRYSFRTDELLLFMARGFDARLSALEAVN